MKKTPYNLILFLGYYGAIKSPIILKKKKLNLSVAHSYQLWKLHYKKFKLSSTPPIHAFFVGDPKFVVLYQDINEYSWWISNNMTTLKKFIENTSFTSFSSLTTKYNIPNIEQIGFLQIRSFYNTYISISDKIAPTFYENICSRSPRGPGLISEIYINMININSQAKLPYMLKWEQECDILLSPEKWADCTNNLLKCTRSITIRETAIKVLTRWYYTPKKLHSIFPTVPPNMLQKLQFYRFLPTYLQGMWKSF